MITVQYQFRSWDFYILDSKWVSSATLQEQVTATMDYLGQRNIHCQRILTRTFSIDYESPAHRTAAELMMSAVPRTCELIIDKVIERK